jgi:hypothetical protein
MPTAARQPPTPAGWCPVPMMIAVDIWGYCLYAFYVLERPDLIPHREGSRAEQRTNAAFLRTRDMEVQQLKEKASQLACPGYKCAVSVVDNLINAYVFMAEPKVEVLAHKSGEQVV